eukprot:6016870-Pyramimonas_sp.AAC.1
MGLQLPRPLPRALGRLLLFGMIIGACKTQSTHHVPDLAVTNEFTSADYVPTDGDRTLCLTPVDLQDYFANCPLPVCDNEGGCVYEQCPYKRFEVVYKEVNDANTPIPEGYRNAVLYDGVVLHTFPMPELGANTFRLNNHQFRFEPVAALRKFGVQYWGVVNDTNHTLEVVLDYGVGRQNVHTGNVTLRYCGFDNVLCGCGVDITPGTGLYVGNQFWPWDDGKRRMQCLQAQQTSFRLVNTRGTLNLSKAMSGVYEQNQGCRIEAMLDPHEWRIHELREFEVSKRHLTVPGYGMRQGVEISIPMEETLDMY